MRVAIFAPDDAVIGASLCASRQMPLCGEEMAPATRDDPAKYLCRGRPMGYGHRD